MKPAAKRRWWKWIAYPGLIGLIFFAVLVSSVRTSNDSLWESLRDVSQRYIKPTFSLTSPLGALTATADTSLIGAQEDRINVLLLGIGGRGHEGSNLTDTIIVASYKPTTREVAMLSIPRD